MHRATLVSFVSLILAGCQSMPNQYVTGEVSGQAGPTVVCAGDTALPADWKAMLTPISDPSLEQQALGQPGKGGLCIAQAYQVNQDAQLTIYRAWNSTNPNSRFGQWWASSEPGGLVAQYREAFEICYQWSPLDKLVSCKLAPGSKVVIGTGQSAVCSEYLTYPVSAAKQVFIIDAQSKTSACEDFDALMGWENAPNVEP